MTATSPTRRLAAILIADAVGYGRLMQVDEAGAIATIQAAMNEVVAPAIAARGGRIVKHLGDGALAEFASVIDAVACAVAIQSAMAARESQAPEDRRVRFRIGVNLGDVVIEGDDILGDGVVLAARLEPLAEPGGVCVSRTVVNHVGDKAGVGFESMGRRRIKNLAEPIEVFRVTAAGAPRAARARGWLRPAAAAFAVAALVLTGLASFDAIPVPWRAEAPKQRVAAGSLAGKPMVAVLPFDAYGEEDATRRLARGLTEDVIADLARFPEFGVIARNSTAAYAGGAVDVRKVGRALGVGFLVEGAIQRDGDRLRITAQLVDADTGAHLWSKRWDRRADDVFAVQREIAEQVANAIGGGAGVIQRAGRAEARRKLPENLQAYDLYLLGTERIEKFTREDVEAAIDLLGRAVELDPDFARAWVELFHAHNISVGFGADNQVAAAKALAAAERAVELDPGDAEAHAALGIALAFEGEIPRAMESFETAVRLAPNAFEILVFYAGFSPTFGEPERGADYAERALALNPDPPMWSAGIMAWVFFHAGRYEASLRQLDRQSPENYTQERWVIRAGALAELGRKADATETVQAALQRFPDLTQEGFATNPSVNGHTRERLLEAVRKAGFPRCASPELRAALPEEARFPDCDP